MWKRMVRPSLIRQIIFLIFLMLITLLCTFVVTNRIAKQIIERKVTDSVGKILLQVQEKMTSFNADMQGISTFLFYSPTIQAYLNDADPLTRVLKNREVNSMFANTISMKENIRGLQLFDENGKLLSRIGEGEDETAAPLQTMTYSGMMELEKRPTEHFYTITVPVYGLDNNQIATDYKGTGRYVMDVKNFSAILKRAKITNNSRVLLLDKDNKTIASEGNVIGGDDVNVEKWKNNSSYIIQTSMLPYSGWKIISIIPKEELLNELDTVERINITTYSIMFVILCLFLTIFFARILKPIKTLLDFIKSYPKKGEESRFNVVHQDEIGVLGSKLNKMLDDIGALSEEIRLTQIRMFEIELSKKQMEISAFRNQINPHFLYNTLESIRAIAFYYDVSEIVAITESLSNMFRYAVKGNSFVTVKEEISHIEEYSKIIDFRFRGRFRIYTQCEADLHDEPILKMLLQPIVENAVFHGLERIIGEGHVNIDIRKSNQAGIRVTIEDNGYGMDRTQLEALVDKLQGFDEPMGNTEQDNGKGIGMLNIYRRLRLFYGDAAGMTVTSKLQEGTMVVVNFPITKDTDI